MKSGKRNKKASKRLRLGKRDRRLLAHLAAYRMSWFEVIHIVFFAGLKPDAVKSTLRRLKNAKPALIRANPLYGQRVYYQLTFAGARAIDTSHRKAEALGRSTILRQYAIQSFLFLSKQERRRLLSREQLTTVFDATDQRLPRANFYLASTGANDKRFGYAVVDYGSDPRRCANRVVKRILQLVAAKKISKMAEAGVFEISVLTLSSAKRTTLYTRLKVSKRTGGMISVTTGTKRIKIRLLIHVVPGLLELIPDSRQ